MRRRTLVIVAILALTAGCGSSVTAPTPDTDLRPAAAPSADDITDDGTNPDGTCRSGYIMANGRCARI